MLSIGSEDQLTLRRSASYEYFTPAGLDNLVLWLDPRDVDNNMTNGVVTSLTDRSTKEHNFAQASASNQAVSNAEEIKGTPLITFDGVNDFYDSGVGQLGNTRLFADSTDAFTVFSMFRFKGSGKGYSLSKASGVSTLRTFGFYRNVDPQPAFLMGICRGAQNEIRTDYVSDTTVVLGARWDGSLLTYYSMYEGERSFTVTPGVAGTAAEETTNILLGARTDGTGYFLAGDAGHQIVYDRALTDPEMARMAEWFSDVLNAPYDARLIMLGASIINYSFQDDQADAETLFALRYAKRVEVVEEAVSGWYIADLKDAIDDILEAYSPEAYQTYCPIHIGGNNVTAWRPYSGVSQASIDAMTADLTYIINAIQAKGFVPILGDITFRDYDGTTYASPENGSLPFNTNVIRPLQQTLTPDFVRSDGTPYLQLYDLILNDYGTYLDVDNVHLTAAGYAAIRQHVVDGIGRFIFTGREPDSIEA